MAQAGLVSATGHSNVLFLVVPRVFIVNFFDSPKSLKGVTGQNEHRQCAHCRPSTRSQNDEQAVQHCFDRHLRSVYRC